MNCQIKNLVEYSRFELVLRTLLGWLYIYLPHLFILIFVEIWSVILGFIAWWVILFTGSYPQTLFEFQLGLLRWRLRLYARMFNLSEGYPSFGIYGEDNMTVLEIVYPVSLNRGLLLLKTFFGWLYCVLPHGIILFCRIVICYILSFLAFWIVLFTGKFPDNFHSFITGTIRWIINVNIYMQNLSDDYPPFSGKDLNYSGNSSNFSDSSSY